MSIKVSIIMGVYNCEKTLDESIDSILMQTYKNWELIVCDDGSNDATYEIATKYAEQYRNIRLYKNECNMGLNYTLNRCLKEATGDYIARMDGDDISLPKRLERQVVFLNEHKEYAIVSSPMIYFDENGQWGEGKAIEKPTKNDYIKGTPFCHAPCMVRRDAYEAVNGYTVAQNLLRVEDYHLWIKMYEKGYKGYNLQEPLYKMRDDRNAVGRRKFKYRINEAYVKCLALKKLDLSPINSIYVLRPILVGMVPAFIYEYLHKRKMK